MRTECGSLLEGQEELLSKTYHSVGGGFIVEEEHFGLSHDVENAAMVMISTQQVNC